MVFLDWFSWSLVGITMGCTMQIQPPIQSRVCLSIALSIWDPIPPRTTVCRTQWHANICAQLTERNAPNIMRQPNVLCLVSRGANNRGGAGKVAGAPLTFCVSTCRFLTCEKTNRKLAKRGKLLIIINWRHLTF